MVRTSISRNISITLSDNTVHHIRRNKSKRPTGNSEIVADTGADTICVGGGFQIMEYTGRHVTLQSFSDHLDSVEAVPVVTAATAYEADNGDTYILIFHEALFLGPSHQTSLLCLNQVRDAGHEADDIPLFLSKGKSNHGIRTVDDEHIRFELRGKTSILKCRNPTRDEMEDCQPASIGYICTYCLLYTSPSPRDQRGSRMPSSA